MTDTTMLAKRRKYICNKHSYENEDSKVCKIISLGSFGNARPFLN